MSYVSLKNLTHFSLRSSIQKPEDLVARAKTLGMNTLGVTDKCSLGSALEFQTECKANAIKPIFGLKLSTNSGHINVLAQNLKGWKNLIKLVTHSNMNFVGDIPTTTLTMLQEYSEGLIALCGAKDSIIANNFRSSTNEVDDNYLNETCALTENLKSIFNGQLYLDLDASDNQILTQAIRSVGIKTRTKCVATSESVFSSLSDFNDFKVLICSDKGGTLKDLQHYTDSRYFRNAEELGLTYEEVDNTGLIADLCESYNIANKPKLPKFDCPNGMSEKEYLDKLIYSSPRYTNTQEFNDRLGIERPVLSAAELDGYFLIVNDYTQYARSLGCMALGRGSAAGSLISYLLGLTIPNPLNYGLLFERFYNAGRNTKDHISYPDIDMDFPVAFREQIIQYIRTKYGENRVAQMITYGRLQGAGALKEVLRSHGACDSNTMNAMTENIPDEASITDDLENDDESSIIRWTLNNRPEVLDNYARFNEAGELVGDYAQYFEQAIRLEGVYRNSGKHAAGIVIAPEPLENICPMVMDNKRESMITNWEMKAVEKAGLIKMDILGLAALDKLQYARNLLRGTI